MPASRTPDYDLVVMNKVTNQKGRIGAAWKNDDGRIGIVLNPCVVLNDNPNIVIALFVRKPWAPPAAGSYKNQDDLAKAMQLQEQPKEDYPF